MTGQDLAVQIRAGKYDQALERVYGNAAQADRYARAAEKFAQVFSAGQLRLFSAPGRVEIAGNHTDHQKGCALALTIGQDIIAVAAARPEPVVRVYSEQFGFDQISLEQLGPVKEEEGKSAALIRGVVAGFHRRGLRVGGFDAYTQSLLPAGCGLSSSAAYEVLVGTLLNHLYHAGQVDNLSLIDIAVESENEYFGKPCGRLDQTACASGGLLFLDFSGEDKPVAQPIDYVFEQNGYAICIVSTGGDHAVLTESYAAVREEMEQVARFLGVPTLSQTKQEALLSVLPVARKAVGDRAVLRAMHFFEENERVKRQRILLEKGELESFLCLVKESGKSSFQWLQNVLPPGEGREQGIALGLFLSERLLKGRGAVRVHGGGFAGTIEAYVPQDLLASYYTAMEQHFGCGSCHVVRSRGCGGVELTDKKVEKA